MITEKQKVAWQAWWDKELEQPLIAATIPQETDIPPAFDHWAFARDTAAPARKVAAFAQDLPRQAYLGAAFPGLWINLGPGVVAAYYTGYAQFKEDTVWFEVAKNWGEVEELLTGDWQEGFWWRYTCECTRLAAEAGKGRWITGMTDLGGPVDILASLRGTQNLLYDLVDEPTRVKGATAKIQELWFACFDRLHHFLGRAQEGMTSWMPLWCRGRYYPLQCDFAAMLSPAFFAEFILPYLREQTERLDYTVYHLDGPGEIPHLDLLLSLPELDGIQWTPGSGEEPLHSPKWFPLYEKILAKGKNLVLLGVDPTAVPSMLANLPAGGKGVFVSTYPSSQQEAERAGLFTLPGLETNFG